MNRIVNSDDDYDDDDDGDFEYDDDEEEEEESDEEGDEAFWNEGRRSIWGEMEFYDVHESDVKMKLEEIGSAHSEMSTLVTKMRCMVTDLRDMKRSHKSWFRGILGGEIRPLFRLTKQMVVLQQKWDHELTLVNECVAIRRKDEHVTKVNNANGEQSLLPFNYGSVIGSCLSNNPHVTDLTINLRFIQPLTAIGSFVYFIQSSRSLQRVSLIGPEMTNSYNDLARTLLGAIRSNPHITELKYNHVYIPATEFAAVMSSESTSPIRDLSIELSNWQTAYTALEQELLVRSVASSNLTRLQLSFQNNDEWNAVVSILRHLSDHPSALSELSLEAWGDYDATPMHALTQFLESTETLQHLELEYCAFNRDNMNCVLDGLKQHSLKPTASITKLSVIDCLFDNDASTMFVQYMQTPLSVPHKNRSSTGKVLQELEMKFYRDSFEILFDGKRLGAAMVSLISKVPTTTDRSGCEMISNDRSPSIGSQLQRLSLCPVAQMTGFWAAIEANAKHIDIPRLHLVGLQDWDLTSLECDLDKLRSLRELQVSKVCVDYMLSKTFVCVLRENDSLHSVSVDDWKNHSLLQPSDSRFVNACCDRNKYLHELSKNITHWQWKKDVPRVHRNKRARPVVKSDHYDKALLIPMLLQAAKQVQEKIRVKNVVSALLTLEVECH